MKSGDGPSFASWCALHMPDLFVGVGMLLAVFMAVGSLTWPLSVDSQVFAYVGERILHGGVPYRDAWEIKGPLTHYVYAAALGSLGCCEVAVRILDLLCILACCWGLRRLTLLLDGADTFGANCAVVFFALTQLGWGLWTTGEPDVWSGMLMLFAVLLLSRTSRRAYLTFVTVGGLVATATLLKPVYLIYLALPAFSEFQRRGYRLYRSGALAASVATFVCLVAVSMLALAHMSGGLHDYADILYYLSSTYIPSSSSVSRFHSLRLALLESGLVVPCVLALVAIWAQPMTAAGRNVRLVEVWLGLAVVGLVAQGRFWLYQWMPVVIALAPLLGWLSTQVRRRAMEAPSGARHTLLFLLFFPLATMTTSLSSALSFDEIGHSWSWPRYALGLQTKERYIGDLTGSWNYVGMRRLSAYIAIRSSPRDTVQMWGPDPLVNVLSGRASPTRFPFSDPLISAGPLQHKYRQLFLGEILNAPPRYVVVDGRNPIGFVDRPAIELLREFPQFDHFLHGRYKHSYDVDEYQLWTRVD